MQQHHGHADAVRCIVHVPEKRQVRVIRVRVGVGVRVRVRVKR